MPVVRTTNPTANQIASIIPELCHGAHDTLVTRCGRRCHRAATCACYRSPRADLQQGRNIVMADGPRRFRTLFISDVHLGTKGCQAERLLDFLRCHEADLIYLVGDIVDGWQLKSSWYWPQAHNDVVQKLLRKARKGTRIVYVPGNHDEFLRDYCGTHFGGVEVAEHAIHESADGRRYLVVHGDDFDVVVTQARWLALVRRHGL